MATPSLSDLSHSDPCANTYCRATELRADMVPVTRVARARHKRGRYCLPCAIRMGWVPRAGDSRLSQLYREHIENHRRQAAADGRAPTVATRRHNPFMTP